MPFFESTTGVAQYYELSGVGPRLLSISGTGGDLRRSPGLADALVEDFEVLAYDQRGLGQSSSPEGEWTMADFADDAAALIEGLGWDDCLVFGVSFGGMVAQEFAIRHPELVRRLVLACTSAGGRAGSSYPLHQLTDLEPDARLAVRLEILDTRWDAEWRAANPAQVEAIAALSGPADYGQEGLHRQLEARRYHDTADRLDRISCPTYVCGGRTDGIAPPANSEFLVAHIPNAELAMFDGGHLFLRQDPTALPAIKEFLAGN